MTFAPVAAAFIVGATGVGCASSPPEWIAAPTPDAAAVVAEGWHSVLPRTWSQWLPKETLGSEQGTFWRSTDGACVAGMKTVHVKQDATMVVHHLASPHRNVTAYLDREFRVELGGARVTRHWIGGRPSVEIDVPNVAHDGVYFDERTVLIVAGKHDLLFARCTAPEDLADVATAICDAFLANLRPNLDAP